MELMIGFNSCCLVQIIETAFSQPSSTRGQYAMEHGSKTGMRRPPQASRGWTSEQDQSQRRHGCDICGKRFQFSWHLKVHVRIHTGERPYQCDLCGKSFVSVSDCNKHKKTHTGEKPYQCPVCRVSFKVKRTLKSHMFVHHNIQS